MNRPKPLVGWMLPDRGVLFVVTGPSGVGKSTLIRQAVARIPGLEFSVSATTRAARVGEREGVDYHFLTPELFLELRRDDAFLEHATVYDSSYGTLREPTARALDEGRSLVLDIDVRGARQVRQKMPESIHVFVLPPDMATLEERLRARGTDSDEVIARRMAQVEEQLAGCGDYDYLVVNGDLDTAHCVFQGVLVAEMSRRDRRQSLVDRVSSELGGA